jgi:hypothetical protein
MGFDLAQTLGNVKGWTNYQLHQRMVQIALYGSIVFWILSSFHLIEEVNKLLTKFVGLKVGKDGTRVVHALIFGLFMYVGTQFILDPVFRRANLVEGADNEAVSDVPDVVGADVGADVVTGVTADVVTGVTADVAAVLTTADAEGDFGGSNIMMECGREYCGDKGIQLGVDGDNNFCDCWKNFKFQKCITTPVRDQYKRVAKSQGCVPLKTAVLKKLE